MILGDPIALAFAQLAHSNAAVRKSGAQALLRLRPTGRTSEIQHLLILEKDSGVAKWLALALARMNDQSSGAFLDMKLATTCSEDATDWLVVSKRLLAHDMDAKDISKLLESNSAETIVNGAIASWDNPHVDRTIVQRLFDLTGHPDPRVRRWSQLAIGTAPVLQDPTPVRAGLTDPDYLVREWAECSLSRIRDPNSVPALLARLSDDHPRVREWAIKALMCYGAEPILRYLMIQYSQENDEHCREAIIDALRSAPTGPHVQDFVLKALQSESSLVVLHSLMKLIAAKPALSDDADILKATFRIWELRKADLLDVQLVTELFGSATEQEQKAMELLVTSPKLQLISDILGEGMLIDSHPTGIVPDPPRSSFRRKAFMEKTVESTLGIIIALKEEFRVFSDMVGPIKAIEDSDTHETYYTFSVPGPDGRRTSGVVLLIGDMGPERATLSGERLIRRWNPSVIANIGIAAGIHDDVLLGDIIVARQVDNYVSFAKAVKGEEKGTFALEFSGDPFKSDATLLKRVINLEFAHAEQFASWQSVGHDAIQKIANENSAVAKLVSENLSRETPIVCEGNLASGPIVGAAKEFIEWLHDRDRQFKGLEMEAAGVALSAHHDPGRVRTLFIRGVSDFGDARKKKLDAVGKGAFRTLAMTNATAFFLTLLSTMSLDSLK